MAVFKIYSIWCLIVGSFFHRCEASQYFWRSPQLSHLSLYKSWHFKHDDLVTTRFDAAITGNFHASLNSNGSRNLDVLDHTTTKQLTTFMSKFGDHVSDKFQDVGKISDKGVRSVKKLGGKFMKVMGDAKIPFAYIRSLVDTDLTKTETKLIYALFNVVTSSFRTALYESGINCITILGLAEIIKLGWADYMVEVKDGQICGLNRIVVNHNVTVTRDEKLGWTLNLFYNFEGLTIEYPCCLTLEGPNLPPFYSAYSASIDVVRFSLYLDVGAGVNPMIHTKFKLLNVLGIHHKLSVSPKRINFYDNLISTLNMGIEYRIKIIFNSVLEIIGSTEGIQT